MHTGYTYKLYRLYIQVIQVIQVIHTGYTYTYKVSKFSSSITENQQQIHP